MIAVQRNCLEAVKAMLKAGANINITNIQGMLPIHIAVTHGFLPVLRALVTLGNADLKIKSKVRTVVSTSSLLGRIYVDTCSRSYRY